MLSKYKENRNIEFALVRFSFTTKTVIDPKYGPDKVFNMIDNWINEESGWIIELIGAEYVNISICSSLLGSPYIKLADKLRSSKKGLINNKNGGSKCFLWCHIRHLNQLKIHPERIAKADKKLVNDLDYVVIKFPCL